MKINKIYLILVLSLFLISFISAKEFGYNYLDNKDKGTTYTNTTYNNNTYLNETVNINITQFDSDDLLHIDESWLTTFIETIVEAYGYITSFTETDPLWTSNYSAYNDSWSSTYNATYDAYNSTGLIQNWSAIITSNEYSHLSNFTDDLGNRGYTHLTNFTDDLGYVNYTKLSELENDLGLSNYSDTWINETFYNKSTSDDRYIEKEHKFYNELTKEMFGIYNRLTKKNKGDGIITIEPNYTVHNVTIELADGYNLIGISTMNYINLYDEEQVIFDGQYSYEEAITNNIITEVYSGTTEDRNTTKVVEERVLKPKGAYWVLAEENTNMTFLNVGGDLPTDEYALTDLWFKNSTGAEKNITDALAVGWLQGSDSDHAVYYFNESAPVLNQWGYLSKQTCIDDDCFGGPETFNPWKGYFIWAKKDNIFMFLPEAEGTTPIKLNYGWNTFALVLNETQEVYNFKIDETYLNSTIDNRANQSGLIRDWNDTGFIKDWNSDGYIKNWNDSNLIINWSEVISSGGNSSFNQTLTDTLYATIDEPLWSGNFTLYNTSWSAGGTDTNCSVDGSCSNVLYGDYNNNQSIFGNQIGSGFLRVTGSAGSGTCPNYDGDYHFIGNYDDDDLVPLYEKDGTGAYVTFDGGAWFVGASYESCGDCYCGSTLDNIGAVYSGYGGDCVGDDITVSIMENNNSILGKTHLSDLWVHSADACAEDNMKLETDAYGHFYCGDAIITVDTNETTRVNAITGTDCGAGNYSYGFDANGNIQCRVDNSSGVGGWVGTATSNLNMMGYNMTNVTNIVGSGILNMTGSTYTDDVHATGMLLSTGDGKALLGTTGVAMSPQIHFLNNQGGTGWIIQLDNDASYLRFYENLTAKFFIYGAGLGDYLKHPGTYTETVGATNRDLFVDNTGKFGYVSSSITSKENVRNLTKNDTSWIYNLNPVLFDYKNSTAKNQTGLIAEEVELVKADLVSYKRGENKTCYNDSIGEEECEITYFDTDKPETVSYSKLVTPLLNEVQNLFDEITDLLNRMTGAEGKINSLETENEKIKLCSKNSKDFNEYKICIGGITSI